MTNHTFLAGMSLGILAGAAMGMAVTAKGMQNSSCCRRNTSSARNAQQIRMAP